MRSKFSRLIIVFAVVSALILSLSTTPLFAATNTKVEEFITLFYTNALERQPDAAGLNSWAGQLASKKITGAQFASGIIFSAEFTAKNKNNEEFVTILFRTCYNREPDSAGFDNWVNLLNTGQTRQYVLAGFINSQEFKNICVAVGIKAGQLDPGSIVHGVTFLTEDGIELNGNVFGQGKKWVILSHMYNSNQTSWFDLAWDLAQRGYVALTFNFRGYGVMKDYADEDLKAAISFVRQYGYKKLFLVGASMGGTASLVVAAEETGISGVVSVASPDDALSIISKLKMPKIFICAEGDGSHAASAKRLYENAVEPKALEIIKNSKEHGTFIFEKEPENAQLLKDLIINFLNSN